MTSVKCVNTKCPNSGHWNQPNKDVKDICSRSTFHTFWSIGGSLQESDLGGVVRRRTSYPRWAPSRTNSKSTLLPGKELQILSMLDVNTSTFNMMSSSRHEIRIVLYKGVRDDRKNTWFYVVEHGEGQKMQVNSWPSMGDEQRKGSEWCLLDWAWFEVN